MIYRSFCHICGNTLVVDYPTFTLLICPECTRVLKALVTEHQDKDVMSGIIEEITPEEEATELEHEEQEQKRSLQSLDKTLKRNRRKDDA